MKGNVPSVPGFLIAVSGGFLTLFMCVMIILYIHKSPHDCRFVGAELITQPTSPRQAVFTAEVVSSGWVRPITKRNRSINGISKKYWVLLKVTHEYWGLSILEQKWVLALCATNGDETPSVGEALFVNAERWEYLPLFDICGRTRRFQDAGIDLRVLHDGRPRNAIRVLARVVHISGGGLQQPVSDAAVVVKGPIGAVTVTSDRDGIIDVSGPPGTYGIALANKRSSGPACMWNLKAGDIRDCSLTNK